MDSPAQKSPKILYDELERKFMTLMLEIDNLKKEKQTHSVFSNTRRKLRKEIKLNSEKAKILYKQLRGSPRSFFVVEEFENK